MSDKFNGACHFYLMDVSLFDNGETFESHYNMVPAYRREKIDALGVRSAKNLSLGVGVLLEKAKENLDLRDGDFSSVEDANARTPYYYNLSHSGTRAICTVCNVRVGCDVERINTDVTRIEQKIRISERFFTKNEGERIRRSFSADEGLSQQEREMRLKEAVKEFYRYWTLKESVIKVMGLGLAMPLDSFEIDPDPDNPGLKLFGDWTAEHDVDPDGYRVYVPYNDGEYAYGLCIASQDQYEIIIHNM